MGEDKEETSGSSSGKNGVHQLNSSRSVSEEEVGAMFPLLLPALLLLSQELLLALLWTLTPASADCPLFRYGSNLSCLQVAGLLVYP